MRSINRIQFLKLGSMEDWHSASLRPGKLVNRSRVSMVPLGTYYQRSFKESKMPIFLSVM